VLGALLAVVLLVAGAALLTVGAEAFAENVVGASARLRVSVLALALLLAGAEPEEAVTAMLAAGQGHPALAAGDAIGANLVILTLTLGLAALVAPLPVSRRALEYAVASAVVGAVAWALLLNGVLSRVEGGVLVLLYVAGVMWVWRREQAPPMIGELAELDEHVLREHVGAAARLVERQPRDAIRVAFHFPRRSFTVHDDETCSGPTLRRRCGWRRNPP